MPELPDIVVYIEALEKRIQGSMLERVRIASPFLLRTAVPPLSSVEGKKIVELRRLGKRICFGLEGDLWLVLHLMIAGRLHWYDERAKALKGRGLAVFEFSTGSLTLTEAGTQKRASLHVVQGEAGLESESRAVWKYLTRPAEEFARRDPREESHAKTRPHRSAHSQWHRQRLLGRDSLRSATFSVHTHTKTHRRRS